MPSALGHACVAAAVGQATSLFDDCPSSVGGACFSGNAFVSDFVGGAAPMFFSSKLRARFCHFRSKTSWWMTSKAK